MPVKKMGGLLFWGLERCNLTLKVSVALFALFSLFSCSHLQAKLLSKRQFIMITLARSHSNPFEVLHFCTLLRISIKHKIVSWSMSFFFFLKWMLSSSASSTSANDHISPNVSLFSLYYIFLAHLIRSANLQKKTKQ